MARPRWILRLQAIMWRTLMGIGMFLHRLPPPCPPSPAFVKDIVPTVSPREGIIRLLFYTPKDYLTQKSGKRYPLVVNFHGGGFTIGTSSDDARWARAVVEQVGAVVVSVDYRLAPEHPFPTAVEDGVDAILHLADHAEEYGIDAHHIAIGGFSSGGNMAFTVPMKLQQVRQLMGNRDSYLPETGGERERLKSTPGRLEKRFDCEVVASVAWYPSVDFSRPRAERKATNIRPDQELSKMFSDLFDSSYLYPPGGDMSDPFLSPAVAPDEVLRGLPNDIIVYTCEFDGLLVEGRKFSERLQKDIGKNVVYTMVEGVPHGWDKAPNPLKWTPGVDQHYTKACTELNRVFGA
ncbi:MAG: hypothetical protein M1812_002627 [Candelaria pacifica]|nr:MAG: hypothetical protein M1812_002627 [Candelaria pacifica]